MWNHSHFEITKCAIPQTHDTCADVWFLDSVEIKKMPGQRDLVSSNNITSGSLDHCLETRNQLLLQGMEQ